MGNINTGDTAFVLICAALVCLMTPGLAFFYGGLVRKKNVITIMMQSFISMGVVTLIWFLGGFSLAFGKDVGGIIGNLQYFGLKGVGFAPNPAHGSTIPFLVFFIYQLMFAIITPALITGAFADRMSFKSYLKFLIIWSILVYIPICHWIWGGGFLQKLGVIDFAGGIVVHVSAGVAALTSAYFIGKRHILSKESTAPNNIVLVAIGTGLLWFGWFGFNSGSALAVNKAAVIAFVNTHIAACAAMVSYLLILWENKKKPSLAGALTGAVAGLATITPAAGYVKPWAALLIGFISSIVCYWAIQVRMKRDIDDALDTWGVHGVGGILGSILVGVFANSSINGVNGLLYGNIHQFLVQILGVLICAVYSFLITYIILKILNAVEPIKVSNEIQEKGLDESLHGEKAYNFED